MIRHVFMNIDDSSIKDYFRVSRKKVVPSRYESPTIPFRGVGEVNRECVPCGRQVQIIRKFRYCPRVVGISTKVTIQVTSNNDSITVCVPDQQGNSLERLFQIRQHNHSIQCHLINGEVWVYQESFVVTMVFNNGLIPPMARGYVFDTTHSLYLGSQEQWWTCCRPVYLEIFLIWLLDLWTDDSQGELEKVWMSCLLF